MYTQTARGSPIMGLPHCCLPNQMGWRTRSPYSSRISWPRLISLACLPCAAYTGLSELQNHNAAAFRVVYLVVEQRHGAWGAGNRTCTG